MIWHPRRGERVRIRYRRDVAGGMPFHGRTGTVEVAASTARQVNALVALDGGGLAVVPRGNLFREGDSKS